MLVDSNYQNKKIFYALKGDNLCKVFPILDQGHSWRLMFNLVEPDNSVEALNEVSISVPKGKFVGVLGRNGAGKSTLLRVLGSIYAASKGIVKVQGILSGLFELGGFGSTFLTGREYAERFLSIEGVKKDQLAKYIDDIYEFSELGDYFDEKVQTYSAGMTARLYFSTATVLKYDIYLIDEILSVGDQHFQAKCWSRLRERFCHGASGILVTHDWSAVMKLCEEAHVLDKGRILFSGPSDRVIQSYLQLPKPTAELARFSDNLPKLFHAESGEDAIFTIDVDILEDIEIEFCYSIEFLKIGQGWEIMLIKDPYLIGNTKGNYSISLHIPELPLCKGDYSFNIFLSGVEVDGNRPIFDARSWGYGNGLKLIVDGVDSSIPVNLPVKWSKVKTKCQPVLSRTI